MIRILLVEDQFFARLALRTVIDGRDDMRVVAEAAKGTEAVALFAEHQPDVTIMDLNLPGISGFEAIRELRSVDAAACIVVLSNYQGSEDVHRALTAGAMGYLTKDASDDDLVEAILTVRRGRQYLMASVAGLIRNRSTVDELTARELEVLDLLAKGLSNQEIADRLSIAEKTVRSHLTHLFAKLGVEDRTQAVLLAIQRGLIHIS